VVKVKRLSLALVDKGVRSGMNSGYFAAVAAGQSQRLYSGVGKFPRGL
jgi:hypothetical protein